MYKDLPYILPSMSKCCEVLKWRMKIEIPEKQPFREVEQKEEICGFCMEIN